MSGLYASGLLKLLIVVFQLHLALFNDILALISLNSFSTHCAEVAPRKAMSDLRAASALFLPSNQRGLSGKNGVNMADSKDMKTAKQAAMNH